MKADELEHVRADIQAAIARSGQNDPPLLPELVTWLLDEIGDMAVGKKQAVWRQGKVGVHYADLLSHWAGEVLRMAQVRAVSGIPYGEPVDEPPHRDEHR